MHHSAFPPAMSKAPSFSSSSPPLVVIMSFFVLAILVGAKWYLFADLVSISLMANDVEYPGSHF